MIPKGAAKEEQLILQNRTADRSAIAVLGKARQRRGEAAAGWALTGNAKAKRGTLLLVFKRA